MVYRHGAILLVVRKRSGVLVRVQDECRREEVNNGEKQDKHEDAINRQTHIVDGMKTVRVCATQTHWVVIHAK